MLENKVLRKIYGSTLEQGESRRHNEETRELYKGVDIIGELKCGRLTRMGWACTKKDVR